MRSMGWHPHEQTEEDEKRLNRQVSSRSQLGDVASADCLEEEEEEVNPKDFPTLTEYVRKKGMPDLQQRIERGRGTWGHGDGKVLGWSAERVMENPSVDGGFFHGSPPLRIFQLPRLVTAGSAL